jgi:hypothetical protein
VVAASHTLSVNTITINVAEKTSTSPATFTYSFRLVSLRRLTAVEGQCQGGTMIGYHVVTLTMHPYVYNAWCVEHPCVCAGSRGLQLCRQRARHVTVHCGSTSFRGRVGAPSGTSPKRSDGARRSMYLACRACHRACH